jgi:hypothetical protein
MGDRTGAHKGRDQYTVGDLTEIHRFSTSRLRDKISFKPLRQQVLGIFLSPQGLSAAASKAEKILIFAFHWRHFDA